MIRLALVSLSLLASESFGASSSVPFYVREMKSERDTASMNENFRSLSGYSKKLEERVSDIEDSGGDVTAAGNNIFSGNNAFSGENAFGGETTIGVSSSGFITAGAFTNANLNLRVCVPGSTRTFTLNGSTIIVSNIGVGSSNVGCSLGVGVLIDGTYPNGYDYTTPIISDYTAGNGANLGFSDFRITNLSAGTHSVCLTFAQAPDNVCTGTYPGTYGFTTMPGIFSAREGF